MREKDESLPEMETTLVLFKPDSIQRRLVGRIITRLESKGLKLVGLKMHHLDQAEAGTLYAMHEGKYFFDRLIAFITSGPVIASLWAGKDAIAVIRKMIGATDPSEAVPGTIRGDWVTSHSINLVHASDSIASAEREIPIFFHPRDIISTPRALDHLT